MNLKKLVITFFAVFVAVYAIVAGVGVFIFNQDFIKTIPWYNAWALIGATVGTIFAVVSQRDLVGDFKKYIIMFVSLIGVIFLVFVVANLIIFRGPLFESIPDFVSYSILLGLIGTVIKIYLDNNK